MTINVLVFCFPLTSALDIFLPQKTFFSRDFHRRSVSPPPLHPTPSPSKFNFRARYLSLSSSLSLSERSGAVEIALRIALSWKGMRMIKVLLLLPLLALFRVCGLIL